MQEVTIKELMEHLPDFFVAERAEGIHASVQFDLSGEQGGQWVVRFIDDKCKVSTGKIESADLQFQASAIDVLDIFYQRLNAMTAFMQGKLQLKGNMNLALRLFSLFDIDWEKLHNLKNNKVGE